MKFAELRIRALRCLSDVTLDLHEGIQMFVGPNGAGKTSILEAAFLLSHGRSFRSGAREALLQRGAPALSIFAGLVLDDGSRQRIGLGREAGRWQARVDGEPVTVGQLVQTCAVVCFEPGSHALIAGPAEERRRFLDWGVFHVEPSYLDGWRRYQRALRQRNALLRTGRAPVDLLEPWEHELAQAGAWVDEARRRYLTALEPHLAAMSRRLIPELGVGALRYRRGWSEDAGLDAVLAGMRESDRARGFTAAGPHRADWTLGFEHAPAREFLSRGQEKLTALACVLAQAERHAEVRGGWPVICLDDLASELDVDHQAALVAQLKAAGAQVLVTGTELPDALRGDGVRVFHVEQGRLTPLV